MLGLIATLDETRLDTLIDALQRSFEGHPDGAPSPEPTTT
jgi:hypothetical protein